MRAKKMKEDDVADLNVDPDETYNADEEGVLLCQKANNNTRSHKRLILGSAVEFEGRNKQSSDINSLGFRDQTAVLMAGSVEKSVI